MKLQTKYRPWPNNYVLVLKPSYGGIQIRKFHFGWAWFKHVYNKRRTVELQFHWDTVDPDTVDPSGIIYDSGS